MLELLITGIVVLAISAPASYMIGSNSRKKAAEKDLNSAEQQVKKILADATADSDRMKKTAELEIKAEMLKQKEVVDKEIMERKEELKEADRRINQRQEMVDKRFNVVEAKENTFVQRQLELEKKEKDLEGSKKIQEQEMLKISRMTEKEAKDAIMKTLEKEMTPEMAKYIIEATDKAKFEVDKKAKSMLVEAIQRCASDHTAEATVTVVNIADDNMKGRIIGREGRNIKAIEALTGIDIIIDDTPEVIVLSSFDPIRREVARLAIERLMTDGRIHPGKIEEMIEKAKIEVANTVKEEGERALYETGIINLNPDLIQLLGKLKYRTSYGQNVLNHSIEVSHIAGLLASELGLDITFAKRAGLLHDIGKSVDHESEGTHIEIGVEILKKYKESDDLLNAVAAHHGGTEPRTLEAFIIQAADAVSASRPGARRETVDTYFKRMTKLEEICNTYAGVEKSYAISAGREVRIMVKPTEVDDAGAVVMARNIAKQIEAELSYPGQVKVNVIRETRAIETAK